MRPLLAALALLAACAEAPAPPGVRHVDAEAARTLARAPGLTVLDVRTPAEHADGAIPGSVNADWRRDGGAGFADAVAALGLAPDAPVLLVCESGRRSTAAMAALAAAGHTDLIHLDGGMTAWRAAGLPME